MRNLEAHFLSLVGIDQRSLNKYRSILFFAMDVSRKDITLFQLSIAFSDKGSKAEIHSKSMPGPRHLCLPQKLLVVKGIKISAIRKEMYMSI